MRVSVIGHLIVAACFGMLVFVLMHFWQWSRTDALLAVILFSLAGMMAVQWDSRD